jgi:hypothetical protein
VSRLILTLFFLLLASCATKPALKVDTHKRPAATSALEREYREIALRNVCPQGMPRIQGQWKFVGESKTPDFSSSFTLAGTAYRETLKGSPNNKKMTTELSGEIRCLFKNRVLFMIDRVIPEGGFGNRSGDAFPCDILDSMQKDQKRVLLICFFDWDLRPSKGLSFEYERVVEE